LIINNFVILSTSYYTAASDRDTVIELVGYQPGNPR
jgi:hypothetical protein